jgi:hypothetical protein
MKDAKRVKKIFSTNRPLGFSVLEVMVAIGLAGVLIFLVIKGIDLARNQTKTITGRTQLNLQMGDIFNTVQKDNTCKIALGGQIFLPGGTVNNVRLAQPGGVTTSYIEPGSVIGGGLAVDKLTLTDTKVPAVPMKYETSPGIFLDVLRYSATLTLELKKSDNDAMLGGLPIPRSLNVVVLQNPTNNQIVACNSDLSTAEACMEAGGVYNSALPADRRCNLVPVICARMGVQYNPTSNSCSCPADHMMLGKSDGTFGCANFAEILKQNLPPLGGCLSGGGYGVGNGGQYQYVNPITGGYSCPSGFTSMVMGQMQYQEVAGCGKYGCVYNTYTTNQHSCVKCQF